MGEQEGEKKAEQRSEPNTNKVKHSGGKKGGKKVQEREKSEGEMTPCATKRLFNLIQRGDTSALQLLGAPPPSAPYLWRSRTCALNYDTVRMTVPTSLQKIQSWRILQLRYSGGPGDLRRLLLSPLAFYVRVRLWSTSESRRSEVALG